MQRPITERQFVRYIALVGATVLAIGGGVASQEPPDDWRYAVSQTRVRGLVLGLLRLPEAVGDGCGAEKPLAFALQSIATATAPPVGTLRYQVTNRSAGGGSCDAAAFVLGRAGGGDEAVPTDESDYEVPALVVLGHRGPWFQVALQRGSAWVRHAPAADFLAYPELLTERLSYLRRGWDGRLWASPDAATVTPAPAAWRTLAKEDDLPMELLGVRRVGDMVWMRIRTRIETCGVTLKGVSAVTGWMRAYRESGETASWFYSRGC